MIHIRVFPLGIISVEERSFAPSPPPHIAFCSLHAFSRRGGEGRVRLGVLVHEGLCVLLKRRPVAPVLLGDPILERVLGQRLDEEVPHGLEDGEDLCAGLPVLALEKAEADVAEGVVCDVGVVDAGDELDDGGLEGVVGGEGDEQAEAARVVDGVGRRVEGDLPGVDGLGRGELDFDALGRARCDLGELLERGGQSALAMVRRAGYGNRGGSNLGDALGRHGSGIDAPSVDEAGQIWEVDATRYGAGRGWPRVRSGERRSRRRADRMQYSVWKYSARGP